MLLILYGLRRGETLGLRWTDIDFEAATIQIRQQLQRIQGQLIVGPLKTRAGQRDMPLLDLAREALEGRTAQQALHRTDMGSAWPSTELVFTTRTGRPVEPRNLVRSFRRIYDSNKLRTIKVHHLRPVVASLLKDLHAPARDAQAILGHSRVSTTLEVYTNVDEKARRDALTACMACLTSGKADRCYIRQLQPDRQRSWTTVFCLVVELTRLELVTSSLQTRTAPHADHVES